MTTSAPLSTEQPVAGLLDLEKELECSICTEILFQPLTLLDCLHTFCGSCLKYWFIEQASAARSSSHHTSNPYTCPSCRASVRETRPNATVTTLLEMWLKANPGRARTDAEKEELLSKYKQTDDVVPKLRETSEEDGRREHRRRRRRHGEGHDTDREAEDNERRQIEEARERSLRDLRLSPPDTERRHRSRSDESRGYSREERQARRRREEERRRLRARDPSPNASVASAAPAVAVPTARQASQADARQRERQIEHQSSLRSLMSVSDGGTGEMEEVILRQIIDEGLLEGINLDDLDGVQEDELSERIAEAYRRRHPGSSGPRLRAERSPASSTVSRDRTPDCPDQNGRPSHERRHHSRSHSAHTQDSGTESIRARENASRHPPVARPHLLGAPDTLTPPVPTTARQRRASDQSRRQTSPNPRTQRTTSAEAVATQAVRSATDLSSTGRPSTSDAAVRERRSRHSSDTRRTAAESEHGPSVSQVWRQAGAARDDHRGQLHHQDPTESPQHLSPTLEQAPTMTASSPFPPLRQLQTHSRSHSNPVPLTAASTSESTSTAPIPVSSLSPAPSLHAEPSITCTSCQKPGIQHELHRHCSQCDTSLCLRCYRLRRGYSFGTSTVPHHGAFSPAKRRLNNSFESAHTVIARKWLIPPPNSIVSSLNSIPTGPVRTTSDPATRLQTGLFCDRCTAEANTCFYSCGICSNGEWGFCQTCANTHHTCTHPLLPIALQSVAPPVQPEYISKPHPHAPFPETVLLPLTATCAICPVPIHRETPWHHCPFHYTSPNAPAGTTPGDYNVCNPCYIRLLKSRKIKPEDGPSGWHRCPGEHGGAKGHRMITICYEPFDDHVERRVVQHDLVGGWALRDTDAGEWLWRESDGSTLTKPSNSTASSRNETQAPVLAPPPGGIGLHCRALYAYFPDREADPSTKDELAFPRGADITEAEDINGDWFWGVYAGDVGLLPRSHVDVFGGRG